MRNGSPPTAAETSSAYSPAAFTTERARIRSAGVPSSIASPRTSAPVSGVPFSSATSASTHSRASVLTSASASRMPVSGEYRAACALTCGSRSRMKPASTIVRPSTPFASPLARSLSSPATSAWSCATISLPQRLKRDAVRFTELVEHPRAGDTVPGLQRSSRIVDAGMNHLAVVRACGGAGPRLALEHTHALSTPGNCSGGGQADDASADHGRINCFHRIE